MHAWHCDICLRIETNKSHIHRNIQEHQFAGYHLSHGILSDEQMKIHKSSINPRDLVTTRGFRKTEAFPGQLPGNFRTGQTKRATAREAGWRRSTWKTLLVSPRFSSNSWIFHDFSYLIVSWSRNKSARCHSMIFYAVSYHMYMMSMMSFFFWYIQCHRFNWACGKLLVATKKTRQVRPPPELSLDPKDCRG